MAAVTPAASATPPTPTPLQQPAKAHPTCPWMPLRLIDLDVSLSLWIHTVCLPIPRSLLKALEISGDGRFWFPIPISLLTFTSRSSPILIGLILGSLLDLALIGLIKHIIRRPRPVYNKGMHLTFAVDHWSFPSGHSSRVFFIAVFLCLCADPLRLLLRSHHWIQGGYIGEPADIFLFLVCAWSAATSASRVLLGRHFVLDVIAGACFGVFEAMIVFHFLSLY